MLGEGLACRALAGKRHHIRGLGHGALGGDLVLARRTLEFFERQLDLIEQPHRAFRALPVERARQLRDLQLLMGNHGLVVGSLGLGHRQFRFDSGGPVTLGGQRRLQRVDIVRQVFEGRGHAGNRIINPGR